MKSLVQTSNRVVIDMFVLIQEHVDLAHADGQIRVIEFIWNVPAQRPKLAALLHQCMEEAHAKK